MVSECWSGRVKKMLFLAKVLAIVFVGFEGRRSNVPRRRRESRRQVSSPGVRENTRCFQWWRHCSHVRCCAALMSWLSKSTRRCPSSLSLAAVEVTAVRAVVLAGVR